MSKENEAQLKNAIVNQQKELKDQEEKFMEAGNPDFDAITKLEDTMKTKLDQIGTSLKEFLLKELHENNKEIDEKMNIVMAQNRTYVESVQNTQPSGNGETVFNPKTNTDFRSIMIETRNEELAEESEKKLRSPNQILHGVNEASNNDTSEAKKADEDFLNLFIGALETTLTTFKSVSRIGKSDPTRKRPIKVVMHNEEEKNKIMANLRNLKDQVAFKGLSVTDDYTVTERKMIKEWTDKVKENNDKESPDSNYIWRVRGTPKNGLRLKKFLKQRPMVLRH